MISMYYPRSDGHNCNMNCFLSMKSTMTMMIFVAIANIFLSSRTIIHSINAFSSSKNNISILSLRNNQRVVLQQQQPVLLLFAEQSKNSRTEDNDNLDSNNNNNDGGDGDTLIVLDWDLSSLLSSDPAMDARFSPLMDVYDAAATCAATVVSNSVVVDENSRVPNQDEDDDDDNGANDCSPSQLPSTNSNDDTNNASSFSSSLIPLSLDYDGPLPPSVTPYRMFVREYNRDMGHDGRFSITAFDDEECSTDAAAAAAVPSLQSDVVFCMDNPLEFIRDNLSYSKTNDYNNGEETVIFIPGPHTVHDTTTSTSSKHKNDNSSYDEQHGRYQQRSSSDRLKYYSQVLDGIPMAQIHTGTHIDQDDFDVKLTSDTINSLISFGLLADDCVQSLLLSRANKKSVTTTKKERLYRLRARDLDIIHTVLSRVGSDTPFQLSRSLGDKNLQSDTKGLKHTLIRLIDIAVESVRTDKGSSSSSSTTPHLVLMTYSATSNVLMAALSEWKNQATTSVEESPHSEKESEAHDNRKLSEVEAELLLHKAITVVTISALSQGFIDGPAYIHVSMNDDHLASSLGVTKLNPDGGGKDAIYLHAVSPYISDEEDDNNDTHRGHTNSGCVYNNDAHNIDSCVIQYLSLVRRINGVTSFREMYNLGIDDADSMKLDINPSLLAVNSLYIVNKGSVGQLEIPPHIDWELIPAMIRATGGERWLWNPTLQLGEGGVEGFYSPLPCLVCAQGELEHQFGYDVYDAIFDSCCH